MLQYRNGKVHIRRKWEQNKRLNPDWVDNCCTQLKYVCLRDGTRSAFGYT
jgi:hypothetical protein